jgi:hypothetical protein
MEEQRAAQRNPDLEVGALRSAPCAEIGGALAAPAALDCDGEMAHVGKAACVEPEHVDEGIFTHLLFLLGPCNSGVVRLSMEGCARP